MNFIVHTQGEHRSFATYDEAVEYVKSIAPTIHRICDVCGTEFLLTGKSRRRDRGYCGGACKLKAFRIRHGQKPRPPKANPTTVMCG